MTVVYQTLSDQIFEHVRPVSRCDRTRWPNISPALLNLELCSSKCCHSMNYVRPNLSNVRPKGRFERTDVLWMKKNCFEHCRLWYTTQEIVHRNSSLVTEIILQWTASFTALAKPRRYRCWIKAVSDGLLTCIGGAVCCAERQWWLLCYSLLWNPLTCLLSFHDLSPAKLFTSDVQMLNALVHQSLFFIVVLPEC